MIYFFTSLGLFSYLTEELWEKCCSDRGQTGVLQFVSPRLWMAVHWIDSERPGVWPPGTLPLTSAPLNIGFSVK